MSRPNVTVNGVQVSSSPAPFAVLGNVHVEWGNESIMDNPEPSRARVQFLFYGEADPEWLAIGHRLEIRARIDGASRNTFSGRIESMTADRRRVIVQGGPQTEALVVTAHAVDYLKEFNSTYVETAWRRETDPGEPPRRARLRGASADEGWQLIGLDDLPAEPAEGAATHYDSITLGALLRRYLSWWGPQVTFWDASYADTDGKHFRRIETAFTDVTIPGDVLTTTPAGAWTLDYSPPQPLAEEVLPGSAVLADVEWTASADSRYTGARVSFQSTRREELDTGETGLQTNIERSVQTWRPPDVLDVYGKRVLELESGMIADYTEYRRMGRRWLDFASQDWRMQAVTIPKASQLPARQLAALFDVRGRRRVWWIVDGVDLLTPWGSVATVRGIATGGSLSYDAAADNWSVSMHITDTRTARPTDLSWDWLQAQSAKFAEAPASAAGDVTFADFLTITNTR